MTNRQALLNAKVAIELNLAAHRKPARADVQQLVDGYPMEHAIMVLGNLINSFPEEGES